MITTLRPHTGPFRRPAFTLLEVMLGVLVLGLGLLGMAAIFPAVVLQQRQASDAAQGEGVLNSAFDYLRSSSDLNRTFKKADGTRVQRSAWERLAATREFSKDGAWLAPTEASVGLSLESDTGDMFILDPGPTSPLADLQVNVIDRLSPAPLFNKDSRRVEISSSRFVWDFAARRLHKNPDPSTYLNPSNPEEDGVEAVVFVRRVDNSIRRARSANDPNALPVADGNDQRPTFNGLGRYSGIKEAQLIKVLRPQDLADPSRFIRRVTLAPGAKPLEIAFVSQIGQKFVTFAQSPIDTLRSTPITPVVVTVREIERVDGFDTPVLVIDPPLPDDLFGLLPGTGPEITVLYTSQVPAAVGLAVVR